MSEETLSPGLTTFVVFTSGASVLERCLASVADWSDHLVAIDTGAQDGAREAAERYRASIYDLEWPHSFAAAYNYAIDRVNTKWTLWLDSDEWLLDGEGPRLAAAIESEDVFLYNVIRRDFSDETRFSEMLTPRLWRTHPAMRLRGICHARFPAYALAAAGEGKKSANSKIRIGHDGFVGGTSFEKSTRNLDYLRRQMQEPDADLYDEICLREAEYALQLPGSVESMLELGERLIRADSGSPTEPLAQCVIQACLDHHIVTRAQSDVADKLVDLAVRWFPDSPAPRWFSALYLIATDRIPDAYPHLLHLERMAMTGRYDGYLSFDPEILGAGLYRNLAAAADRLGDRVAADRARQRLRQFPGID